MVLHLLAYVQVSMLSDVWSACAGQRMRLRLPGGAPERDLVPAIWGRVGPATSAWSPPGNGSPQVCVFVRCADVSVVSVCMLTVTLLVRLVWSLSGSFLDSERAGKALGQLVSEVLCLLLLRVLLACVGRFPGREEPLAPSVSRSPPRHLRTTGRPMGPATPLIQPKFSRIHCFGSVGSFVGLMVSL